MRQSLLLIGFTAVIAQVVLMRELIVISSGNEISLGLMLAAWLFWTALGSALAPRSAEARKQMALLQILAAAALPFSIVAIRSSRSLFHAIPGEMLGPGAVLVTVFISLSGICLLSGALFSTGVRLYSLAGPKAASHAAGVVYLLETIGAALGGACAALIFLGRASPVLIAFFVAWLNLFAAARLLSGRHWYRRFDLAASLILFSLLIFPMLILQIESGSLLRLWKGFHVVSVRNSRYGNLVVVQTRETKTLFENGLPSFTVPDPAAAEETVHYALLEHPGPRSLLLIGGGVNGTLAEAFRHPSLAQADYVELDPAVLELARQHFSAEWKRITDDPRVRVHFTDGRLFLRASSRQYDVIIVNLSDPQTAQLNRFYTVEFYREAAARLAPGGVLSFRLSAAENYISPGLAALFRSIHKTLGEVFPEVAAMPGASVHFFATKKPGTLTLDPQALIERLRSRKLETSYVREYYLPFRLSADRRADLAAQIRPQADTPVNRDFAPIAYYFDVSLWASRFHSLYERFFRAAAGASFPAIAALVLLVASAAAAAGYRRKASAGICTAAMGFTMIGLNVLLLLGFQAVYGYVYQQLALLTASFMAGMALGSWLGLRSPRGPGLAVLQCVAAAAPLLVCFVMPRIPPVLFLLIALLCGALGGYQFLVASRAMRARMPGVLYALDLAGASIGAILLSAWFIPVLGFYSTSLIITLANLPPALAVWGDPRRQAR